jgi:hypothetical protein
MAEDKITAQAADEGPEVQFSGSYKFRTPVTFEGQTYDEVKYDLNTLKARDVITCKNEAFRIRKQVSTDSVMTDDLLHVILVARSADMPASFTLELGAADYGAWAELGQLFFALAFSALIR